MTSMTPGGHPGYEAEDGNLETAILRVRSLQQRSGSSTRPDGLFTMLRMMFPIDLAIQRWPRPTDVDEEDHETAKILALGLLDHVHDILDTVAHPMPTESGQRFSFATVVYITCLDIRDGVLRPKLETDEIDQRDYDEYVELLANAAEGLCNEYDDLCRAESLALPQQRNGSAVVPLVVALPDLWPATQN